MKIFIYGNRCVRQKTRMSTRFKGLDPTIKTIIMRIHTVAFLVCVTIMNVCASVHAQNISISVEQAPLKTILNEIKKQSGYQFLYKNAQLENTRPVSLKLNNAPLKTVLDEVFKDQPLTYEILDKTIVLKIKAKSILERISNAVKGFKVTGKVSNEAGQPMAGVTVKVKGTDQHIITDKDGFFSIEVADNKAVLLFSYVGYQMQEQLVSDNANLTVVLKEAVGQLDELTIVSTGYQNLPKERATGSFELINKELFNRRVGTNVLDRLDGIVSGLIFNKSTGTNGLLPGNEKLGITIRGRSTIDNNVNADPLIILDNFPYEGNINNLNPNDIESVTILKDAAAASIWGARSGNGVIVITTKKGKFNQPLKIDFNTNFTIGEKPDLHYSRNYLNSGSYIDIESYLFSKGYYDANLINTTTYPVISTAVQILAKQRANPSFLDEGNNQLNTLRTIDVRDETSKYFYQTPSKQQYALNFNGGSEKVIYGFNLAYDKNRESLVNTGYNRISFNSSNSYRPIKQLELSAAIIYTQSKSTIGSGYTSNYPYNKLADENGNSLAIPYGYNQSYIDATKQLGFYDWNYRPLDERNLSRSRNDYNNLILRGGAKYQFTSFLNSEVQYQYEQQTGNASIQYDVNSYYARNLINKYSQRNTSTGVFTYPLPVGDILSKTPTTLNSDNFRWQLNYNQVLGGKHAISAISGIEIRQIVATSNTQNILGYNNELGIATANLNYNTTYPVNPAAYGSLVLPAPDGGLAPSETTNRYISYYANAAYTYLDRYTVSLSGRKDGANIFGVKTNDKITPLWSAGIGWEISKEPFYSIGALPYLKLRSTYGFNGNVYNASAYLTASYAANSLITGAPYASITSAPNPELRWEKIQNTNIGIDFAAGKNIVSGSIEIYEKLGKDLIQDATLAPSTGFSTFKGNSAKVKTRGIDVTINTNNLNGDLKWNTSILYSYLKDKVISYETKYKNSNLANVNSVLATTGIYPVEGNSLFGIYAYRWAGLDPANGDPMGYINGLGSKDYVTIINSTKPEDVVYKGSSRPTHFGAIRNTFTYKGISLSANITYRLGYYFRKRSISLNYTELLNSPNADYDRRWQQQGDELTTYVPSLVYVVNANRTTFYQGSEVLVGKGDNIRLQDIGLNYEIPQSFLNRLPVTKIQVYAYVNNLGIIWKANKSGIDPDYNQGAFSSYTSNTIATRSYSIGIRANFK